MKEIDIKKRLEIIIHTNTIAKVALCMQDITYPDLLKELFPDLIKAVKVLEEFIKGIQE